MNKEYRVHRKDVQFKEACRSHGSKVERGIGRRNFYKGIKTTRNLLGSPIILKRTTLFRNVALAFKFYKTKPLLLTLYGSKHDCLNNWLTFPNDILVNYETYGKGVTHTLIWWLREINGGTYLILKILPSVKGLTPRGGTRLSLKRLPLVYELSISWGTQLPLKGCLQLRGSP